MASSPWGISHEWFASNWGAAPQGSPTRTNTKGTSPWGHLCDSLTTPAGKPDRGLRGRPDGRDVDLLLVGARVGELGDLGCRSGSQDKRIRKGGISSKAKYRFETDSKQVPLGKEKELSISQFLLSHLSRALPRCAGRPPRRRGLPQTTRATALFWWHYLSNATCVIRPHLFYALFIASRIIMCCYILCHV